MISISFSDHFDDVETAGKVMPNEVTALAVATEV